MKKTVIALFLGMCVGLLAGSLSGSFAAVSETVEAQFAKFNLVINGGAPKDIEPLTYKGSTYLPVRDTANLLGYDLTYKADMRTIELNKTLDSMISDLNAMGSEPMSDSPNGKSIADQLKEVEDAINRTNNDIYAFGMLLQNISDSGFSEETIAEVKGNIEKSKQKLTELEAKKAELEVQLKSSP